jgi:1-deoxy-D-xylulose-5-phosphate synthase
MTVAAPKNGAEMLGLLRAAVEHTDGPFSFRYPRDASPDIPEAMSQIAATPYATWEVPRQGRDVAILAVGTMVNQSLAAAELLAADGLDVSVVNCRYLKPYDEVTLNAILASHTHVLTVEEGTVVNGFGAFISSIVHQLAPTVRTAVHGVPDRIIYSAPRKKQLASLGLDPAGIAERVRAFHESEALAG